MLQFNEISNRIIWLKASHWLSLKLLLISNENLQIRASLSFKPLREAINPLLTRGRFLPLIFDN